MAPNPNSDSPKHFSVRTTLVLLLSVLAATAAGYLFYAGTHSFPLAILTAGGAFVATWTFIDHIIQ